MKMAKVLMIFVLCLSSVQVLLAHGEDDHTGANETPQEKSSVKVKVPSILNMLPDFDSLFKDFDFGSDDRTNEEIRDTPIRRYLKNVRTNYQNVRGVVQSALNLDENDTDMFNLDMQNKGPKTQLDVRTPFGQISLDSKSRSKPKTEETSVTNGKEPQKPLNEQLGDLIRDQAKRLDDFTLKILGPRQPDGEAPNLLSVSNKKDKTSVDLTAPIFPVRVSVASQGFSERSGWTPTAGSPKKPSSVFDEDWDPEDEYNEQIEHQKKKYMDMRMQEYHHPMPASQLPPRPHVHPNHHSVPATHLPHLHSVPYQQRPHAVSQFPSGHVHHSHHVHHGYFDPHLHEYPGHFHSHPHSASHLGSRSYQDPASHSTSDQQLSKRSGYPTLLNFPHLIMSNLPIVNYHDHRNMAPVFGHGVFNQDGASETEEDENYIRDLEEATSTLTQESKDRLRSSFEEFRKSLNESDSSEDLEPLEEPVKPSWLPKRVADQRDLEIAFFNIDQESSEMPSPSDRVVVAFTMTGVPLKIYMDSRIQDPIRHLQSVLADAGVTLNIPVSSFESMKPVEEVLYVGAGNTGSDITEAVSLEAQNIDDVKKSVKRFLKVDYESREKSSKALTEALHDVLTREELKFPDTLADNFRRNPVQVLADIVTFLSDTSEDEQKHAEPEHEH